MAGPCSGWDLDPKCCDWASYDADVKSRASALASMVMWAATGRQFGLCEITVRPCTRQELDPQYQTYPVDDVMSGAYVENGVWHNSCRSSDSACNCSIDGQCAVLLDGPTTTTEIQSVTIDGAAIAAASYIVVDGNTLVRIDGECWPTCSKIASTTAEFEITYNVGRAVPDAVIAATEQLACEFAKACTNESCTLPMGLKTLSRQGVEVEVADLSDLTSGRIRTGIRAVDMIIASINPYGRAQRATILSPDLPRPRRVS